jgi:transglutaminase-like putative cysteine protease
VQGLRGTWLWDSDSGAIGSERSTTIGQDYSVTALQLLPTAEQLRQSDGSYPRDIQRYLDLPARYPALIHDTAVKATGGSASSFDAAVALQDYLRGPEFTYDTDAPVDKDYDGAGADVIAAFLQAKRGYCVHFASAMAVMARTLGIPSRVVVGYLPGTRDSNYGEGFRRFNVTSHDLHSWPELYFTGIGWVPFEPTPGRGSVPDYATPETSTAGVDPSTGLPSSAARPSEDPTANDAADATGAAATAESGPGLADLGLALALAVVLALVPGALRAVRRMRRRRALRAGAAGPETAWLELRDTAVDHGLAFPDTETPREQAARVDALLADLANPADTAVPAGGAQEARDALRRLRSAHEWVSYARESEAHGTELTADLDRVTAAIAARSTPQTRWRARLLPASFWPDALSGKREARPRRLGA